MSLHIEYHKLMGEGRPERKPYLAGRLKKIYIHKAKINKKNDKIKKGW